YSTLSQLGYMTVALGVSAYSAAVYHLMTHAFFKALLFLAAGSVIIGMHHEQDMRKMGGLRKYMPVTFWTSVIGTLALVGTPFFSGFYSKDVIIEAAKLGAGRAGWIGSYAYWAVLLGAFVTSFYSFRLLYLTYFGEERFRHAVHDDHGDDAHPGDAHGHHGPHEPREAPWVVTVPPVLLAIPSIQVLGEHDVMARLKEALWHGPTAFALHGFVAPAFWLVLAGFLLATLMYIWRPGLPAKVAHALRLPIRILENKYGMDDLWIKGF